MLQYAPLPDNDLAAVTNDSNDIDPRYIIQPYEVFNQLSSISIRNSAGPDNIPNIFYATLH